MVTAVLACTVLPAAGSGATKATIPCRSCGSTNRATRGAAGKGSPLRVAGDSVVTVLAGSKQGTAFAFGRRGELLTNAHVVGDETRVDIVEAQGKRSVGSVKAVDKRRDLALLSSSLKLKPLDRAPGIPRIGQHVFAIGSPLGLSGSVADGVISATGRHVRKGTFIQTDVALNPGNSGGPLLDGRGRVLGVDSAAVQGASGISFAIPIEFARGLRKHQLSASKAAHWSTTAWLAVGLAACALLVVAGFSVSKIRKSRNSRMHGVHVEIRPTAGTFEPDSRVRLKPKHEEGGRLGRNRD
jgi:S1-C subfamily serine protease